MATPVTLVDDTSPSGAPVGTAANPLIIGGSAASSLGKAEDAAHTSGDIGVMALGVRNDADAALSGTDLDYTPLAVDSAGRLKPFRTASATITQVASVAASTTIIAANANRRGLILVNTDANACKIKYGATASAASFTAIVAGNGGQWEMPEPIYTGIIDGIWDVDGAGVMAVTEL